MANFFWKQAGHDETFKKNMNFFLLDFVFCNLKVENYLST